MPSYRTPARNSNDIRSSSRELPSDGRNGTRGGDVGSNGGMVLWLQYLQPRLDMSTDYSKIVTVDPGRREGKLCICDLRITVYDVLEYLASGMSEDEILADFPDLRRDDIRASLAFADAKDHEWLTTL